MQYRMHLRSIQFYHPAPSEGSAGAHSQGSARKAQHICTDRQRLRVSSRILAVLAGLVYSEASAVTY